MAESRSEIKPIGGYFEIADCEQADNFPHKNGILLNTARNALEYILRSIKGIKLIYLPYFTCEVVLEPIKKLQLPYKLFHINQQLEIEDEITLNDDEYIIANNYYGIKDIYIQSLYKKYGNHLIVDCAQSFFTTASPGIKAFYSTRKFVGVADGGIAYLGNESGVDLSFYDVEPTETHSDHLYIRKEQGPEAGFKIYQANEVKLDNQPIRLMSDTTRQILESVDYDMIRKIRRDNFKLLHNALNQTNLLSDICYFDEYCVPLVYPFYCNNASEVREMLRKNRTFTAQYWPNILRDCSPESVEYKLASNIVSLPVDQRYGEEDMKKIIEIIQKISI